MNCFRPDVRRLREDVSPLTLTTAPWNMIRMLKILPARPCGLNLRVEVVHCELAPAHPGQ